MMKFYRIFNPKPDRFLKPVRFIITLFVSLIFFQSLSAQHISVKDFKKDETSQDARIIHPRLDQNGEKAALIKVQTTETDFDFQFGILGMVGDTEQKVAEIWVYVPKGSQRITIMHPKLGSLRDYAYPIPIEAATVYIMELTTARIETTIIEPEAETQWLVVTSTPDGADVYIDNIHKGQTPVQMEMNTGTYSYRIEKPLYHPKAGRVALTIAERTTINETLDPNFGYLKITTQPESGAEVSINGNRQSQTTPFTTDRFVSGTYQLTLSKPLYHTETLEVKVKDGETTEVNVNLRANFGTVTINTKPETDAEVLVNDINTGKKTPCDLDRLPTGQHQITVRKEWYQPKTIAIDVTEGYSDFIEIEMQPTFGILNVQAEHQADIYINDQQRGKGTWEGRLIAGWYTVEARKDKYHSDQKRVEIKLAETQNLSLHPKPKTGMLRVQTTPYDADIKLNGVSYGKTPTTLRDLLIGNYEVELSLTDYAVHKQSVTIIENETEEIVVTMSQNISVNFTSNPSGADIIIEGKKMGVTPASIPLALGRHSVTFKKSEYLEVTNNITVTNDNKSFSFSLKPDPKSIARQEKFIRDVYPFDGKGKKHRIHDALFKGKGTIKVISADGHLTIVTPAILGDISYLSSNPKPSQSLTSVFVGVSSLGKMMFSPSKSFVLDVMSINYGLITTSRNHKTRLIWKNTLAFNYQFPIKPDKEYRRVNLLDTEDGISGFDIIPLFSDISMEFHLGGRSFLIFTAGAMWSHEKREWYLKSEANDYINNGGSKPTPVTGAEVENLESPYFEGFVPYFGVGLRF
jgi:hypothetical protein